MSLEKGEIECLSRLQAHFGPELEANLDMEFDTNTPWNIIQPSKMKQCPLQQHGRT